jgi:small subunit ribosomal protein S7e
MERIQKKGDVTELERQVVAALTELEGAAADETTKKAIAALKITRASAIATEGFKLTLIKVPYKQIAAYQKLETLIVSTLEKKLEGFVIVVAKRTSFTKTPQKGRRTRLIRPVGRTLKSVNEALLNDVVFPTTIVGKRIHYNLRGEPTTIVFLDSHDKTRAEERLGSFAAAYRTLTGIKAVFQLADH